MKRKLILMIATFFSVVPVFAADQAGVGDAGAYALGATLALGLAALGGGLAQGKIGAAAMDGLARNPQARDAMFVPMILALVFVETLVIFTFALSFLIQGKI